MREPAEAGEVQVMRAAAADPVAARVIDRRDNGTALVEVPVMVVTPALDLSKTEGGGKSTIAVTEADLAQMAANFAVWPKPVGVGFDGFDGHQRERGGPQMAFVNSLRVEAGALLAVIELGPVATRLVVDERAFRAFSMEGVKDPETPTVKVDGWVLRGGLFTNNPATDSQFRIAAASCDEDKNRVTAVVTHPVTFPPPAGVETEGVRKMAEDTTTLAKMADKANALAEELQTSLVAKDERIEKLDAKLRAAVRDGAEVANDLEDLKKSSAVSELELQASHSKIKRLEQENSELQAKLSQDKDKKLSAQILKLAQKCVGNGFTAAFFEGCEANPLAWFKAKGFSDVKTLEEIAASAPTPVAPSPSATSSGPAPQPADDAAEVELSDEDKAAMVKLGIDPKFADVDNSDGLAALRDKEKKTAA